MGRGGNNTAVGAASKARSRSKFSSAALPPLSPAEREQLLAAGRAGDVKALSELLLSRNCAAEPKLRKQAVGAMIEARIDDYAERWDDEFSQLLHEIGLAAEPKGGFEALAGVPASDPEIRADAIAVSKFTMGESLDADHKMTVPYLKERVSEGYKWALYRELEISSQAKKDSLLGRLVGAQERERLYREHGAEAVLEALNSLFWHNMRQHWLKVRRGKAPRDPADATRKVLAQAGIK